METIRVAIAHPDLQQRIDVKKMLFDDEDMEVASEIEDIENCMEELEEHEPDLLLLSLELASASELGDLIEEMVVGVPSTEVLLLAPESESDELARKLVRSGAFDYLTGSFEAEELIETVREIVDVSRRRREKLSRMVSDRSQAQESRAGKIVTVFSTKGGVGRSLLAVNLACTLRELTEKQVALVDLDLQFGDDAILLDMKPTTMIATLARDCKQEDRVGPDLLENYMHTHEPSGVKLLPSPARPEEAEYVEGEDVEKILDALRRDYDYVIIDTSSHVSDPVMAAIEGSDLILLLLTLELPTIKNGKLMLELMDNLGLSKEHVRIMMNRDVPDSEIQIEEIEEALDREIIGRLPSEGDAVMPSIDEGTPVVLSRPDCEFSRRLFEFSEVLVRDIFDREDDLVETGLEEGVEATGTPSVVDRLLAGVVDHTIAGVLALIFAVPAALSYFYLSQPLDVLLAVLGGFLAPLPFLLYFGFLHAAGGVVGKNLFDLELVSPEHEEVGLGTSFVRAFGLLVSMLPLGLGYLWMLLDEKQRALHDFLAGTRVVSSSGAE